MKWCDFEVKGQRSRSQWDQIWSKVTRTKMHLLGEDILVDDLPSKNI